MIAINGVYAVFRVEAVMNATGISRESVGGSRSLSKRQARKKETLFAQMLDSALVDADQASEILPTTVYGRDARMMDSSYRSREYHY